MGIHSSLSFQLLSSLQTDHIPYTLSPTTGVFSVSHLKCHLSERHPLPPWCEGASLLCPEQLCCALPMAFRCAFWLTCFLVSDCLSLLEDELDHVCLSHRCAPIPEQTALHRAVFDTRRWAGCGAPRVYAAGVSPALCNINSISLRCSSIFYHFCCL